MISENHKCHKYFNTIRKLQLPIQRVLISPSTTGACVYLGQSSRPPQQFYCGGWIGRQDAATHFVSTRPAKPSETPPHARCARAKIPTSL